MIWVDSVACVLMGAGSLGLGVSELVGAPAAGVALSFGAELTLGVFGLPSPGAAFGLGGPNAFTAANPKISRSLRPRPRIAFARVHECGQTQSVREALTAYLDGASVRLPGAMWLVSSEPA